VFWWILVSSASLTLPVRGRYHQRSMGTPIFECSKRILASDALVISRPAIFPLRPRLQGGFRCWGRFQLRHVTLITHVALSLEGNDRCYLCYRGVKIHGILINVLGAVWGGVAKPSHDPAVGPDSGWGGWRPSSEPLCTRPRSIPQPFNL